MNVEVSAEASAEMSTEMSVEVSTEMSAVDSKMGVVLTYRWVPKSSS